MALRGDERDFYGRSTGISTRGGVCHQQSLKHSSACLTGRVLDIIQNKCNVGRRLVASSML